jgi:hypothetical protein
MQPAYNPGPRGRRRKLHFIACRANEVGCNPYRHCTRPQILARISACSSVRAANTFFWSRHTARGVRAVQDEFLRTMQTSTCGGGACIAARQARTVAGQGCVLRLASARAHRNELAAACNSYVRALRREAVAASPAAPCILRQRLHCDPATRGGLRCAGG